jgi:acyl-[acyl-carrier-protein]-phospholipid O-acyltransferase/long-chain-fatty-acid--[acyl-carrier-protein] ligase
MVVDKVPLLGTGKTDYVTATTMAREQASSPEREVA